MPPLHDKKFVPCGVALTFGEVKNSKVGIYKSQDFIENILIKSGILEKTPTLKTPFFWIGLIYRYGIKNDLNVHFQRISKKYGDLTVNLELDMNILMWADQNNLDLLLDVYVIAALEAFIQICKKYKLPDDYFRQERAKYSNIPNTIAECKAYKRAQV